MPVPLSDNRLCFTAYHLCCITIIGNFRVRIIYSVYACTVKEAKTNQTYNHRVSGSGFDLGFDRDSAKTGELSSDIPQF